MCPICAASKHRLGAVPMRQCARGTELRSGDAFAESPFDPMLHQTELRKRRRFGTYGTSLTFLGFGRISGCADSRIVLTSPRLAMASKTLGTSVESEKDFAERYILPILMASAGRLRLALMSLTISLAFSGRSFAEISSFKNT